MTQVAQQKDVFKNKRRSVTPSHVNLNVYGLNGENGVVVLQTVPQVSPFILFLTATLNIN